jgi:uncharacterized protein YbjT (DUF2867 family)
VKLLVLGGTGGTGRHLVEQALDARHDVTVLARDPSRVPSKHQRLHVVAGDASDTNAVTDAARGCDAVLSALGRGLSFNSQHVMQRCVPSVITAMTGAGVRRLIFTSSFGVGDSYAGAPLLSKLFFSTLLRGIYADKLIGERAIRASDLDWTIVQPAKMTNGAMRQQYRCSEQVTLPGVSTISRADTAHFILRCLGDPATVRKTLIVSD